MKSRTFLLLCTILIMQTFTISAINANQVAFFWHSIKKKVQENRDTVFAGIIGAFIVNHFYMQYIMHYRMMKLQSTIEKIGANIRMTNILLQRDNNIDKKVDTLHTLLDSGDVQHIIKDIEKYVNNPEISIIETADKLQICWCQKEHYGNATLNELEQLLLLCKEKYQYPVTIEVDLINNRLECILLPYKGLNTRSEELFASLSHKKKDVI